MKAPPTLGIGVGWRRELALWIDRREDLTFVELLAEGFDPRALPPPVKRLCDDRGRGMAIVVHGTSLSLGGAERPDRGRLDHLARLAERTGAVCVSEHLAFVRGGGRESGHLLPVARTWEGLEILVENLRIAQAALPVPLAVENIASFVRWPEDTLDEADFLARAVEAADVGLLLDLENLNANQRNHALDVEAYLRRLPLERLVYTHVAGGVERGGLYHDTHTRDAAPDALALLTRLGALAEVPGVLLERDGAFPPDGRLDPDIEAILGALPPDAPARRHAEARR